MLGQHRLLAIRLSSTCCQTLLESRWLAERSRGLEGRFGEQPGQLDVTVSGPYRQSKENNFS